RQNVRSRTKSLPCEHASSPSHTALHFVTDHKDSVLIADLPDPFHKFLRGKIDAAISLKRLQDDRAGLVTAQCFHTIQIIELCKFHTRDKGLTRLSVRVMTCHRHRSERPSVEGILHGNKLISPRAFRICVASG